MLIRQTNKRGITLLELIVVMVIIVIGTILVAPNIGVWVPNYRLRSATRDVISTLRTAQLKAVSNNTEYQVLFNQGAGTYILQYRDTGGNWVNEGATQTLPYGIQISDPFPGNIANFNTNSTSSTGGMTLRNTKGQTRRITLTPATGRVKVD